MVIIVTTITAVGWRGARLVVWGVGSARRRRVRGGTEVVARGVGGGTGLVGRGVGGGTELVAVWVSCGGGGRGGLGGSRRLPGPVRAGFRRRRCRRRVRR